MDYRQEQADEVEALRAIFDDVESKKKLHIYTHMFSVSENEPRTITFNISGEVNGINSENGFLKMQYHFNCKSPMLTNIPKKFQRWKSLTVLVSLKKI
jgi:hypothetical protein